MTCGTMILDLMIRQQGVQAISHLQNQNWLVFLLSFCYSYLLFEHQIQEMFYLFMGKFVFQHLGVGYILIFLRPRGVELSMVCTVGRLYHGNVISNIGSNPQVCLSSIFFYTTCSMVCKCILTGIFLCYILILLIREFGNFITCINVILCMCFHFYICIYCQIKPSLH